MENNQPTQQVPQTVVVDQTPQVTPVQPDLSPSSNKKKLVIIVIILVTLSIVAGGLIFLRNSQIFKAAVPVQTVVNTFDDLKTDLETTDVGASESDLSDFDKDLNSL